MAQDSSNNYTRISIDYIDGVNSVMASNVAKKEEMLHAENIRSPLVGTADKREGQEVIGSLVASANYGLFYYHNDVGSNQNLFRISNVNNVTQIYYLNNSNQWVALSGPLATVNGAGTFFKSTLANGDLYLSDINNDLRYISEDTGSLVVCNSTGAGTTSKYSNVYDAPTASLINYYKNSLYLADYRQSNGVRVKNGIFYSSKPLGVVSKIYSDVAAGVNEVPVTDTKYFIQGEIVEVYLATKLITVFTVDSVKETSIVRNHNIPNYTESIALLANSNLWVFGTYSGKQVFRWPQGPVKEGIDPKEYNSFKLTGTLGNDNEQINVLDNIGNVMIVASSNNIAVWNDYVLQNLDLGVGCVSKNGYVKCSGSMFFIHYTGIFMTAGDMPKVMSTKVERYLNGASKAGLESSAAGKKGRNVFFTIGDVTLYKPDGSFEKILPNVCLEYSLTQDNWYVHTNVKADMLVTWMNTNTIDSLVAITHNTNYPVVEFLKREVAMDLDQEIPFRFDTKNIMLCNVFENIAHLQEIIVEMERGKGLKVFVSLDMGDWYELPGDCAKGANIIKITNKDSNVVAPVRARNMRISLRHNHKQLCKVSKLAVIYLNTKEQELNKEDYSS